jgi:hypothetical protein
VAQPDIETASKHIFEFPLEFMNLTFSEENETGNFTGQATIELTSEP